MYLLYSCVKVVASRGCKNLKRRKTPFIDTLQETNIFHVGKRNIIFKSAFLKGDMLVPRRVDQPKLNPSFSVPNQSGESICLLFGNESFLSIQHCSNGANIATRTTFFFSKTLAFFGHLKMLKRLIGLRCLCGFSSYHLELMFFLKTTHQPPTHSECAHGL